MKLPELSATATPDFTDAATCSAWLEHVPLANPATAQQQLLSELATFNTFPASAANRLAVMEAVREAVSFVQLEQAKRFTNRPLPMAQAEAAAFESTIELWEQMRLGYLRCLDAAVHTDPAMHAQGALLAQRTLAYSGLKMFHHYRAYREVAPAEWRALNEAFAHALQLDVAEEPVRDFLNRDIHDTSPRIAYARALLMSLANPNELGQRQLTFVAYLLERWASKLELAAAPVDEGPGVPPLYVDLAGERGPERSDSPPAGGDARVLDSRKLAKSLRNRVALLRKGESPAKLALGEDCVQPSCEQLLVHLYRQWCQAKPSRAGERRAGALEALACNDVEAIWHYSSGKPFRQPGGGATELTKKQRDEIATFGRVSTRDEEDYSDTHGFVLEHWKIHDETAQGMRMVRPAGSPGRRYSHGQLVGVKPADAKHYFLGQVRWLMSAKNGDLHAGIKLMPGAPSPVSVRGTGLNATTEQYAPALALGAVQALNAPPALVLPSGWFKPKRVIEVFTEGAVRARLLEVLDRGTDFERVTYENA
ncbi:MAG: hypothetical protein ACT4P4_04925 [Betaproteobacteria bacterium]